MRTTVEILALTLLLVASNRWVSMGLARNLEWRYPPTAEPGNADVIVLLGGGTEPAQTPRTSAELNSAGDRLLFAARLYRDGKAPVILVSGGNITWLENRASTPASDMAQLLQEMGVPASAILQEDQSQNTYENALNCAKIIKERGFTRVLLVTSAMHMPRSVYDFHAQGIEVIPAPTDYTVTQAGWQELTSTPQAFLVNLLPTASNLSLTTTALKEYLGLLAYSVRSGQ